MFYFKTMKQWRQLLILAAAALLLVGAAIYRVSDRDSGSSIPNPMEPAHVSVAEYTNKTVGISFAYPETLTLRDNGSRSGDSGQQFSGVLSSDDFSIRFGGATTDFSYGRGGSILDTHGYSEQSAYYLHYPWGSYAVDPREFIPINDGTSHALVIRDTEIGHLLNASSTAAFINLPGDLFPGIVFVLSPSQGKSLSNEAIEIFINIIESARLVEATNR